MRTVLLVVLTACGSPPDGADKPNDKDPAVDPITVVEVAHSDQGSVAEVLIASAVVDSEASADLVPEATGVVREILKDEGDPVSRGDVLAILDNVSLGTGAARASAEVSRLEAQVAEAKELMSRGAVSAREVSDLEHQLRTARLSSREASSSYGSTRLSAPFDGVVAMRDVHVGELATSAKAAFQVVDPTRLRVVASLPERDLGRVALDQPARLVSAYDDEVWTTGTVSRISPVVDASSGTFRVTVAVSDPGKLRPGQFVSVRIEVDRHDDVLVVPKQAVLYEDGVPVVYLVGPAPEDEDEADDEDEAKTERSGGCSGGSADDGDEADDESSEDAGPELVATRTPVDLGLVDDAWAEILDGIGPKAEIITVGHSHLRDGGRVRIAPADRAEGPSKEDG